MMGSSDGYGKSCGGGADYHVRAGRDRKDEGNGALQELSNPLAKSFPKTPFRPTSLSFASKD